ncbi:MAG: protein kinase [Labilithrix sp.]|nr:protein kinase [Labilithrix sp.]
MSEAALAKAEHEPLIIGRYALFDALASGGMATVHLGRLLGPVGFGRTVAVKRLHTHYTTDPDFVTMFMDEARIVARIRHPNVVPMVDVIESRKGLFLVMEYVHGESFSKLLRTCRAASDAIPLKVVSSIMHGVLLGLHAAHETKGASGELLDVVHRDVSPQNIIVGADGVARVLDFGVAKAAGRAQVTREGQIKGKLTYMAPEQIRGRVDRRADVFAAAVVLWEALAGRRFHEGAKDVEIVTRVVQGQFPKPSEFRPDVPPELDAIVMRGLEVDVDARYQDARALAIDLERKVGLANPSAIGEWVERLAADALRQRGDRIAAMEMASGALAPLESVPPPGEGGDAASSDPRLSTPSAGDLGSPYRPPSASEASLPSSVSAADAAISSGGTPLGTELPAYPARRDHAPVIAVVSFLGALALVGAILGGLSLYARGNATTAPSMSASTSAPPPLAGTGAESAPAPSSTLSAAPSGAPDPSAAPAAEPSAAAAPSSKTNAPVERATPDAGPTARPTAAPYRPPPPKKDCDPPYVVDEQGHRKYKRECMGGD